MQRRSARLRSHAGGGVLGLIGQYVGATPWGEFAEYAGSPKIDNYTRFPAGIAGSLDIGKVRLRKVGAPSYNLYVVIHNDSGVELARSGAVAVAGLTGSFADVPLTFTPNPTVTQGQFLRLLFEADGGDGANYAAAEVDDNALTDYSMVDPLNDDTGDFMTVFELESA